MQINRLCQKGEDTEDLLQELRDKEKSYERGKKRSLDPTTLPRSAPARRALRSRLDTHDIPPRPDRSLQHLLRRLRVDWLDVDWTLYPEDRAKELRLRTQRDEMIKEQLQLGKSVIYRSSGWSLYPLVWSNDLCSYDPVTSADEVSEDDIVFCQVQPGDRFFAHLVSRKWFEDGEWYFTISNSKGWENGWCSIKHIYGRLIRAEH